MKSWTFDELSAAFAAIRDPSQSPAADHVAAELPALGWRNHITAQEGRRLADLATHHRIMVIRHPFAGLTYSTLISLLLALLIEGVLAAGFIWLAHWSMAHRNHNNGPSSIGLDNQAAAIGGMQTFPVPPMRQPGTLIQNRMNPQWLRPAQHLNSAAIQPQINAATLLNYPHPTPGQQVIIGWQSNLNAWQAPTPSVAPRPVHVAPRSSEPPTNGEPSRWGADPNAGFGSPYSLVQGDHSLASSDGGAGIGRGLSAANDPNPLPIESSPLPQIPLKYELSPPPFSPILKITVLPNGRPGKIIVFRSSGVSTVDQACIDAVKLWKFLPAIKNGRPVIGYCIYKFGMHGD